jgi:hypothetical protein
VDRPEDLAGTRKAFATLALPARVAAARVLARSGDAQATDAFRALLANTRQHGEARVLQWDGGERWMSSPMREQCELIRLVQDYPQYAPEGTRRALVAGLSDLYAGGAPKVDTQTGATCLRALHGERMADASPVTVQATVGAETQRLALRNGEVRTEAAFEAAPTGTLKVAATETPMAPIAYLARVDFNEDARHAQSSAIGFAIARQYEVMRNHKWVPLGDTPLRDNDWVRITLTVTNGKARWFIAVTDDLPGGLRPMDLSLAGVAGVNVQALGDLGDWSFDQRKLDPRKPKFYAERLPPGRHVIHYFARAANGGDYLAAPAVAELMYGEASRARTASDRIRIADPAPTAPAIAP